MNYDELNLTKDEIGIIPIDIEDLISKALEKQLYECDPSTEENRMLLATFLRKEENDQVYFNLLSPQNLIIRLLKMHFLRLVNL